MPKLIFTGQVLDTGRLTDEQTEELATAALQELTEEALFRVLNAVLTTNQKEELAESWFNIDSEPHKRKPVQPVPAKRTKLERKPVQPVPAKRTKLERKPVQPVPAKRTKLEEPLRTLLLMGVKQAGSYAPTEALGMIEEQLTFGDVEQVTPFLQWCHDNNKKFGDGNLDQRYTEYLKQR